MIDTGATGVLLISHGDSLGAPPGPPRFHGGPGSLSTISVPCSEATARTVRTSPHGGPVGGRLRGSILCFDLQSKDITLLDWLAYIASTPCYRDSSFQRTFAARVCSGGVVL